jgi:F0F1-type ATP synthase assembly protein I
MPFNRPIPESKQPRRVPSALATLMEAEKMMQIAILLPSAALIGWLIGAWADSRLHQSWIAVAGFLFGGVSGLVYVIRLALSAGTRAEAKNGKENKDGKP